MHGDADEDVGDEVADPGLPHLDDDVVHVSLLHVLVDVGEGAHVQRGVGQHGVHPRHAEDGERDVEAAHHHHVPVVGCSFHLRSFTKWRLSPNWSHFGKYST